MMSAAEITNYYAANSHFFGAPCRQKALIDKTVAPNTASAATSSELEEHAPNDNLNRERNKQPATHVAMILSFAEILKKKMAPQH